MFEFLKIFPVSLVLWHINLTSFENFEYSQNLTQFCPNFTKFSQFSRSATRARYLCQINWFSHKTSKFSYTFQKLLFRSCNICPPFKPKKENTGLLFTLDYRIWRVWKEPGHVTGSLNSWDHVQVGNFSQHFYHFSCCSDFFLRVDYD